MSNKNQVVIVGAGYTGLTAGLSLSRAGKKVLILENGSAPGGLAGTFEFRNGVTIEKFYHHWFNNDIFVSQLVKELGLDDQIIKMPSRTGMYYNGRVWRLSTPLDLLRFTPLSFKDRIRLGLLVFKVRKIKQWKAIEHLSIQEWLEPLCGANIFRIVWEPLIRAKFSLYADKVSAVWMWKKLVLRGNTRDKQGKEELVYFKGGFGKLAQAMADTITKNGGEIRYNTPAIGVKVSGNRIHSISTPDETIHANHFLFTPAFSIIADLFAGINEHHSWIESLRRVNYLGNICLVLQLDRSLSTTYWLNVNDPGFPFVGVIEHTNFDSPKHYQGSHIVFISRYLPTQDPLWQYDDDQYLAFVLEHLVRMFPKLDRGWIQDYRIWRTSHAQPVTERDYSAYLPGKETPFQNGHIATMAHIYPEDRGTNYAIREGKAIAKKLLQEGL